jgi:hypothetical protein
VEFVAYDLSFETPLDRASVTDLLAEAAVPLAWAEDFELRVPGPYEEQADQIFDQLTDAPNALPGSEAEDYAEVPAGASSSEVAVDALARLFDAADRLMHRPTNRGAAQELNEAGALVVAAPTPEGFGPAWWVEVGQLTENLMATVGSAADDDDEFRETAQRLRSLLRDSV